MIALYSSPFLFIILKVKFHVETSFCYFYVSHYRATNLPEIFSLILKKQIQIIP